METITKIINDIFASLTIPRAVAVLSAFLLLEILSYKFKIKILKNIIFKIVVMVAIFYILDVLEI